MPRKREVPNAGDRQESAAAELAATQDLGEEELDLGEPRRPVRRRPRPKEGTGQGQSPQ